MPATYFVLTVRGDRGPYDRDGMREALQSGEVQGGDRVRSAFGRMLGTVDAVLAGQTSDRLPRVAPQAPEPSPIQVRPRARGGLLVAVVLAVLLGVVALLAWPAGRPVAPPPPQVTVTAAASAPAEPVPPPRPVLAPPSPPPVPVARAEQPPPVEPPSPGSAGQKGKLPGAFVATGSSITGAKGGQDPRYLPSRAIDAIPDTIWKAFFNQLPLGESRLAWLEVADRTRQPITITGYALTSAVNRPVRDPAAWRLLAIGVDGTEREVDSRSGQTWSARRQRRDFTLAAPATAVAFRLEFTAIADRQDKEGIAVQLAEFELLLP